MTRPRRSNRKSKIMKSATLLFLEHGFNATSIAQIAEHSGISTPGIYYHFTSKQALLAAIIQSPNGLSPYRDSERAVQRRNLVLGVIAALKVFTIAYGEDADQDLLLRIANRTNGKLFTGDPATIETVYLAISAEQ